MIGFETPDPLDAPDEIHVTLSGSIDGQTIPLGGWEPITWQGAGGDLQVTGDRATFTFRPGFADVIGGIQPALAPLPALVTDVAVEQLGRSFTATFGWAGSRHRGRGHRGPVPGDGARRTSHRGLRTGTPGAADGRPGTPRTDREPGLGLR